MRRRFFISLAFTFLVTILFPVLAAFALASDGAGADAGTDIGGDTLALAASLAGTVCALLATVLPTPDENSNIILRLLYRLIQWVALNFGKAKNAQDTPAKK